MIPNNDLIGKPFPTLRAETLSSKTIVYPDSITGQVSLLLLAFERQTQSKVDSWLEPFFTQFGGQPGIQFYEIPMLASKWKLIAPIIDGGMRSGIPKVKHDNVSTFYGDVNKYCRILGITDKSDCYVYLLDQKGNIRWQTRGRASVAKVQELFDKIEQALRGE